MKFTREEAREVAEECLARARGTDNALLGTAGDVLSAFLEGRILDDESSRGTPKDWLDEI